MGAAFAALWTTGAFAQWLNYPAAGIPRTAEGKPNLAAPAPKASDGKPDLTGIWSGPGAGGYDRNIFTPLSIWSVIRYIHANPVRRRLCTDPLDWPWSSAVAYEDEPTAIPVDKCQWFDDLAKPFHYNRW